VARKIKFALEMAGGVKVRSNLEELRENFDLDKAVGHFLSGKLVEWLEDRYYEDEAEKISVLDKDSPDFRQKLCDALGVEYDGGENLDVEFLARLNEKKNYLRQKTDDKSIVENADKTALNQEDLSDLLDMEEPTIYLCGENFNIPIRVENKKYIGILGTPKISIKANSQGELDEKNISFENCILPFAVENKFYNEFKIIRESVQSERDSVAENYKHFTNRKIHLAYLDAYLDWLDKVCLVTKDENWLEEELKKFYAQKDILEGVSNDRGKYYLELYEPSVVVPRDLAEGIIAEHFSKLSETQKKFMSKISDIHYKINLADKVKEFRYYSQLSTEPAYTDEMYAFNKKFY